MSEYIHHIAGRLRLKLAQIRRNPRRASEIRAAVCRIDGVISAEANVVTGSLLIHYEAARIDGHAIVLAMKEAGWLASAFGAAPAAPMRPAVTGKMLDTLAEKLIERSAIALLGALL